MKENEMTMHCSSCGAENPETDEGYTECCLKSECCGGYAQVFGNKAHHVTACCWGTARAEFARRGWKVESGMCNMTLSSPGAVK